VTEGVDVEVIPFKKLRYVEVEWVDANTNNAWTGITGEKSIEPVNCKTRGWVMRQDGRQIMLGSTISFNLDGDVDGANATTAIPMAMVTKITDFPSRRQRKPKAPAND
jgi:hypothetical protein